MKHGQQLYKAMQSEVLGFTPKTKDKGMEM
jgi:hypothetical protein